MSHTLALDPNSESLAPGLANIDVPPELLPSVSRHRANLARLVEVLKTAGVEDTQIEASVNGVVASYRDELLQAIKALMKSPPDV